MSEATLMAATLAIFGEEGANWIGGANARTSEGKPCGPLNPNAVGFDLMGALLKAHAESNNPSWADYHAVYNAIRAKIPGTHGNNDPESFNDAGDWAGIATLFT